MRLDEIDDIYDDSLVLFEFVNSEMINPSFKKEVSIKNGKYKATIIGRTDGLKIAIEDPSIDAMDTTEMTKRILKEIPVAYADFKYNKRDDALIADMVYVDASHRGQSLAKEMYSVIYELGNSVKPSHVQLIDGKKMWEKFRKEKLPFVPDETNSEKIKRVGKEFIEFFKKKIGIS